ncbi:tetratricopeptide repeat protein [Burkholderia alba]|uniref:tetratricopeptide repeat protein n=1 Tax=Burkholderia alba TaxID=2683677 RepID=UPI002B051A71|nr:tetratricopeptide repeat protein [Burkholderia alba]
MTVTDSEFPLLPPFIAFLRHAVAADQDGRADARSLWLDAAAHLHAVDDDALRQLTIALVRAGRAEAAVELAGVYRQLRPAAPAAGFNLGYALQMAGRHGDAIAPYRRVLADAPDWPSLRNNLAIAIRLAGGDPAEELALLERAVAVNARDDQAWVNLIVARLARFDLDGALQAADTALALTPDNPLALNNAATACKEAQRWDDAERYTVRACERAPDDLSYRFNLAILHLVRGNYALGWPEHEVRWQGSGELRGKLPALSGPRWRGEPLAGKTLLVWGEQGMGDLLQFCRYVPRLAERVRREGGRLLWNAFPQMGELLVRSLGGAVDGYSAGGGVAGLPAFDYELPLMSAPWMLDLGAEPLGEMVPYLHPEPAARDAWRARLDADAAGARRLKVGLAWTGSLTHQRNPFRRVGLERYAAAFGGIDGVTFYSLQPGAGQDIAAARAAGFSVIDHTDGLRNFDDTAALIGALDLVVTVCTSIAHLSGALGQRTWVLLDVNPHWPWLLERRDSPAYPSATLYRQRRFAQWEPVMEEVARDLRALAASAG